MDYDIQKTTRTCAATGREIPAGETVWLTAYWYNPRRETGPSCEAVCTEIRTGVVMKDEPAPFRLTPAAASWAINPLRKAA